MKRSPKSSTYRDYMRGRLIRYSLVMIACMYGIFILFIVGNIMYATFGKTQYKTREIQRTFEADFTRIEEGMDGLVRERALAEALSGDADAVYPANVLLYDFVNQQALQANFILADAQGRVVATNLYSSNQALLERSEAYAVALKRLAEAPGELYTGSEGGDFEYGQAGAYTLGKAVRDGNGVSIGALLCNIRSESVYAAIQAHNLDHVMLTDRYDNMIFSTYRTATDPMEKYPSSRLRLTWQNRYMALLDGKEYYVYALPIQEGRLQVYALTSIDFQKQLFVYGSVILMAICVLTVFILRAFINGMMRRNMQSIDNLVAAAQRIGEGELEYRVESQAFDEFEALNEAFNILSKNLQAMIRHNEELAEHKRVLELKQIEGQFNPHFIFNTLETIRYKAILEPQVASEMVFLLAKLMRYTMHFGNDRVPLRTDVKFLEDYLRLQKMRFGERLAYTIDVEEALLDMEFPKLLLQPVVENCFGHALQQASHIAVGITGRIQGNTVELTVSDDGDGIAEPQLAQLRAEMTEAWRSGKHFGLYSVHRTVQLVYGEAYGVQITSAPGEGTRVRISMPVEEGASV